MLRARTEQDADMWCDTDPPPLKRWTELRIPFYNHEDFERLLEIVLGRGSDA